MAFFKQYYLSALLIVIVISGCKKLVNSPIDKQNLPQWTSQTPYTACTIDTLLYFRAVRYLDPAIKPGVEFQVHDLIYTGVKVPIDEVGIYPSGGFTAQFPQCVDCTLRGTNKQPAFWK